MIDDPDMITLVAGPSSITVLPRLGFTITSLRHHGEEYLNFHGGAAALRGGHTTAIALLAPWANRLRGPDYVVDGRVVTVVGAAGVHLDANGLPIHGTMVGRSGWEVGPVDAAPDRASITAVFDAAADPEVAASFPFPHTIEVELVLTPAALSVTTTLTATGAVAVPVSFGWHPYLRLPDGDRDAWSLELPDRRHLELDALQLPTGAERSEAAETIALEGAAFDDGYRLGPDRTFALVGPQHRLRMTFDAGYSFAQVYAPIGSAFVALEPMTASTDALSAQGTISVEPGDHHTARFGLSIS
ncbi:MAG: aldose 1-epimerase [Actinobacteria bacterium]|nr:aldose 1-epimerase [Actinomycetota bacterium]